MESFMPKIVKEENNDVWARRVQDQRAARSEAEVLTAVLFVGMLVLVATQPTEDVLKGAFLILGSAAAHTLYNSLCGQKEIGR
jgi:hypothetical protein